VYRQSEAVPVMMSSARPRERPVAHGHYDIYYTVAL
jgi:hypothetical protein